MNIISICEVYSDLSKKDIQTLLSLKNIEQEATKEELLEILVEEFSLFELLETAELSVLKKLAKAVDVDVHKKSQEQLSQDLQNFQKEMLNQSLLNAQEKGFEDQEAMERYISLLVDTFPEQAAELMNEIGLG